MFRLFTVSTADYGKYGPCDETQQAAVGVIEALKHIRFTLTFPVSSDRGSLNKTTEYTVCAPQWRVLLAVLPGMFHRSAMLAEGATDRSLNSTCHKTKLQRNVK